MLRFHNKCETFVEAVIFEAAELIEAQASLLGQAQYAGVQRSWSNVVALIEQGADEI